jgi:hypothetical protein
MKHYTIFFRIISFCFLVRNSFAQDNIDKAILTLNELNDIQVFIDRKFITDWSGVRRDVKLRDFSVVFDSTSSRTNKEYYSNLIINQAKITLIRKDKPIAFAIWRQGLPEPLNSFYTVVQLGDRYEMKFTLIAQRKTGEQVSLENKLVYNLPLL